MLDYSARLCKTLLHETRRERDQLRMALSAALTEHMARGGSPESFARQCDLTPRQLYAALSIVKEPA